MNTQALSSLEQVVNKAGVSMCMNKNMQIYFCTISIAIIFFSSLTAEVPLIPRSVLFGEPDKVYVRISPDGSKLAYLAPADGILNIWVKTIGKEDDHPVTHDKKRGIYNFNWSYNGSILYRQDADGDENWHIWRVCLKTGVSNDLTPFEGVQALFCAISQHVPDEILVRLNKENPKFFDVYRLNLVTGTLKLIEKNPGNVSNWIVDSHLCVRAAMVTESDGGATLLMRDNEKSAWVKMCAYGFEDVMSFQPLVFSENGLFFYLIDSLDANTRRLVKMNCRTGKRETLVANDQWDLKDVLIINEKPIIISFNEARVQWKSLCPEFDQDLEQILAANSGDAIPLNQSIDDMKWVLGFDNDTDSGSYYLYDRTTKRIELLFHAQSALNAYQLAPMTPISFTSRDGLIIHGYLTCPVGIPSRNLPLVLCVHGGPRSRDTWGFNSWAQWCANRGYVCLQVNFRGSTGYGKQFLNAGNKEWGNKMQNDLTDAVNWAIGQGIVDPKKIAIFGGSYGGYAALCGATMTPDFYCCSVDMCGPANLITLLNSLPPTWEISKACFYKWIGNPETERDFLKSRSPLSYVDRIKIPILIAQGANDPRVKQAEAEQIVAALKARGLPYEYMLFPDEGHGFARRENRMKFTAAVERFLAKHLGGRVEE